MLLVNIFIVCLFASGAQAFSALPVQSWDLLKVRWGGWNCNSADGYFDMPMTMSEDGAEEGFTLLSGCTDSPYATWSGKRYVSDVNDEGLILIYNIDGQLAGVQSGINGTEWYPFSGQYNHPFMYNSATGKWYITYYFQEPSTICSRTESRLASRRNLYIQNGTLASEVTRIPLVEDDTASNSWYPGVCLPTMGQHFRHNVQSSTQCDQIYPAFTLYNHGQLDGFGWTIMGRAESSYFEYPPVLRSPNTPSCLLEYEGPLTNLHFYLSTPCGRTCG